MNVSEAMTMGVETISPADTAQYAAARMKENDIGFLPVTEEGRAVGVVTDRDIALRCCAEGRDPHSTTVREIMTRNVIACRETEELSAASRLMEQKKIRRLVVTDEAGIVNGLLSVDDLALRIDDPSVFSRVLRQVAPGPPKSPAGRA
jgi:CBS domain-containing protein